MIIVTDSSALIALAYCSSLYMLDELFGEVAVSQVVYDECVVENKPQSVQLKTYLQNKVVKIDNNESLSLPSNLGKGEISAMLLYKKLNADYLFVDDNRARKIAKYNNINTIGSLGVILLAKKQNLIEKILPILEKLEKSDLHISSKLLLEVRNLANE